MAARARRVLAEVDGVRAELDELRGLVRGRVAIGALLPAGGIEVTALLARFPHAFPGIEVGAARGDGGRHAGAGRGRRAGPRLLADRRRAARAARGAAAERGGGGRRLPARHGAAQAAGSPPPTSPASRWRRPRSGSAIKTAIDEFFATRRRAANISLESGDPYLIRCLVSDGFGAAILPASITRRAGPPVETRPLRPADPASGLPDLAPRTATARRRRRAFIEFVREQRPAVSTRVYEPVPTSTAGSPTPRFERFTGAPPQPRRRPCGRPPNGSRSATRRGSGGCCAGASRRPPGSCPIATCSGATRSSSSPRASARRSPGSAGACGRSAATIRSWRGHRRSGTRGRPGTPCPLRPLGRGDEGRSAIVSESRVEPVDRGARWRMRALWSTVGQFQRLIGGEALEAASAGPRPRPDQAPRARRPGTRGPHPPGCRS